MIFVTGGARSGKSVFAEQLALKDGGGVTYIATAAAGDAEMEARIAEHRRRRPASWTTVEAGVDLPGAIETALGGGGAVLVDCLTVYLSNLLMAREEPGLMAASSQDLQEQVGRLADVCRERPESERLIVVSNEVGMGIVPDTHLGRIFRDVAGRANQRLAAVAKEVFLCVSGIPIRIK